jgi:hypothetical protein
MTSYFDVEYDDVDLVLERVPLPGGERPSATLATLHIGLAERVDGSRQLTSCAHLLIRPDYTVVDASGEHGDERFYELCLTREQAHALARTLDRDWRDVTLATGHGLVPRLWRLWQRALRVRAEHLARRSA